LEVAYRDLGAGQGGNGVRSELLTPTVRDDALYSLLTMSGVVPRFGIGAVRINSDILTGGFGRARGASKCRRRRMTATSGWSCCSARTPASRSRSIPTAWCSAWRRRDKRARGEISGAARRREVALLGAGWQAGAQAMAISAVRDIKRIRCYSPHGERRKAFARAMQAKLGIEVAAVATAREAVSGADIVMCATNSTGAGALPGVARTRHACRSLSRLELDENIVGAAEWCSSTSARPMRRSCARRALTWRGIRSKGKQRLAGKIGQTRRSGTRRSPARPGAGPSLRSRRHIVPQLCGLGYQFAATGT
jgi:hypothetical protein